MEKQRNILQRLNDAKLQMESVQKATKKQGMHYEPVLHDDVTRCTRGALVENGIYTKMDIKTRIQNGNRTEIDAVVYFINVDDPTDMISQDTFGYGICEQDKGPGKAMSYAFKYGLLKGLMLPTGDDPELDQNTKFKPSLERAPAQPMYDSTPRSAKLGRLIELTKDDPGLRSRVLTYNKVASYAQLSDEQMDTALGHLEKLAQKTNQEGQHGKIKSITG